MGSCAGGWGWRQDPGECVTSCSPAGGQRMLTSNLWNRTRQERLRSLGASLFGFTSGSGDWITVSR